MRFDEVELQSVPFETDAGTASPPPAAPRLSWLNRLLALLTDLSLFAALALALSPLLPSPSTPLSLTALGGFVLMVSFYYFVGAWTLWGKTIGGAIFDARVDARSLRDASMRWLKLVAVLTVVAITILFVDIYMLS
jgi:uncharacterized RDD family membrane protein YckC